MGENIQVSWYGSVYSGTEYHLLLPSSRLPVDLREASHAHFRSAGYLSYVPPSPTPPSVTVEVRVGHPEVSLSKGRCSHGLYNDVYACKLTRLLRRFKPQEIVDI
jgi:hypothetical protein